MLLDDKFVEDVARTVDYQTARIILKSLIDNSDKNFIFAIRRTGYKDAIRLSHSLSNCLNTIAKTNMNNCFIYVFLEEEEFCTIKLGYNKFKSPSIAIAHKERLLGNHNAVVKKKITDDLKEFICSYYSCL